MRKEKINAFDWAEQISKMLPQGILLNTMGEKFNSMVIGWGHLGVIWNLPTFVVYVRQSRYTKPQLDATKEFSISVPLTGGLSRDVFQICGVQSGRDVDKAQAAHLTLVEGNTIRTPGILEYPLTLECRVLYQQDQVMNAMPEDVRQRFYGDQDFHTAYIGQIMDAYIIRED